MSTTIPEQARSPSPTTMSDTSRTVGAGAFGWYWYDTGRFLESTNDAYVQADYTTIAPKVSGYISEVPVEDNQQVKAGDVLARIDDRDYRTALAQAKADVASAEADIRNIDAQLAEQQSVIAQAESAIVAGQEKMPDLPGMTDKQLKVLVEGDARLLNRYSVMAVNPARYPHVQAQLATAFVDDLTGAAGQRRIFDFQVGGEALFFACPQP